MRGVAPFELDQPWRALLDRRLSNRVDQRIAGGKRVAAGDGDARLMIARQPFGGGFQLGGAEVARAGIDEIAHPAGRGGEAQGLLDTCGVLRQEDARAGVVRPAIAIEAILAEQPAERGGADRTADAIGAGGERLGELRQRPDVGCGGDDDRLHVLVGVDGVAAGLAGEALRGERGADAWRLGGEPCVIGVGRDQRDGAGGLAAVGLEQGVGHIRSPG